ncbi:MAG: response regulator [Bacteroidia bacterium]|nr:response regulator [Bacteroidia bacterium]
MDSNFINIKPTVLERSSEIKSVLLIDSNKIDIYVNCKILELHGVAEIVSFSNVNDALSHLSDKNVKYQLILIDIYIPVIDGFEFIDKFIKQGFDKLHGEICLLTSSINPSDKEKAIEKNVRFIEKPLTIEKLL